MRKFLISVILLLLFPIQNSSAVSPSLDETIEFIVNGDYSMQKKWSIDDCNLTIYFKHTSGEDREKTIIDLNKINLNAFEENINGFTARCLNGECVKYITSSGWRSSGGWRVNNGVEWIRNTNALSHLYENFCTGSKSAF
tara:strand:+ start:232 stop:651 length:420 start_codon:yes stop_codon:yes gene_type:complete